MKYLLLAVSLVSSSAFAVDVPNTFTGGAPALANEVNDNFSELAGAINANEADINNLQEQVSANTSSISSLTGEVGQNALLLGTIASEVTTLQSQVTSINPDDVSVNTTNIGILQSNVDSLAAQVDILQEKSVWLTDELNTLKDAGNKSPAVVYDTVTGKTLGRVVNYSLNTIGTGGSVTYVSDKGYTRSAQTANGKDVIRNVIYFTNSNCTTQRYSPVQPGIMFKNGTKLFYTMGEQTYISNSSGLYYWDKNLGEGDNSYMYCRQATNTSSYVYLVGSSSSITGITDTDGHALRVK